MPLKTTTVNNDLITFAAAQAICNGLSSKGVPVSGLAEEIAEGGSLVYVEVTDPNWVDDGAPHVYYASIWGKFMDISTVAATLGNSALPWLNRYINLASVAFETTSEDLTNFLALQAIDNLTGVAAGISGLLSFSSPVWTPAPAPAPSTVGSVPVINGQLQAGSFTFSTGGTSPVTVSSSAPITVNS